MSFSPSWLTIRWLVRDTFRQAISSGIFWLMLGMSALTIAACLSVDVTEGESHAQLRMGFGAFQIDAGSDRAQAVHTLQLHLATWVADAAGLLLILLWTAGFLPAFLSPDAVAVLLVKPLSRGTLLAGKFLGVLAAGPCCALLTARWALTAIAACYALALGVILGVPDHIFATAAQYALLAAVAAVGAAATAGAAVLQRQHP